MPWTYFVAIVIFGLGVLLALVAGDLRLSEIVAFREHRNKRHGNATALVKRIIEGLTPPDLPPPPPPAANRREALLGEMETNLVDVPSVVELVNEYAQEDPEGFVMALRHMVKASDVDPEDDPTSVAVEASPA